MAAQLIITEPSGRKRIIPLSKGSEVSIARGTGSDAMLVDRQVSRRHCTVRWDETGISVEDQGSQNGTFVNSQRVSGVRLLRGGDLICIGNSTVRLVTLWEGKGMAGGFSLPFKLSRAAAFLIIFGIGVAAAFYSESLGILVGRPGGSALESRGSLTVRTNPSGAMLFVNNKYAGVTPVKLSGSSGTCSLRVVLSGYEPHSQAAEVNGEDNEMTVTLVPIEAAYIKIASEPSDAEVYVDGNKVGRTPVTAETVPGAHEIMIQKTNYIPWKGSVEVGPGETAEVLEGMEHRGIANYLKLLEEDPNNVSYYCQLGHLYILQKRYAEACDVLRTGMEIFCQGKDTSEYAGRMKWLFDKIYFGDYFDVADQKKHDEIRKWIIDLYAEMIKKYPAQKSNLVQWLSGILKRAGREAELAKILEHAPEAGANLEIYFQAADIYLGKQKYERAVGILNKAVNLGPKNYEARCRLGKAYLSWCKRGKAEVKDDAVKNLQAALELCNDEKERAKIEALRQEATEL